MMIDDSFPTGAPPRVSRRVFLARLAASLGATSLGALSIPAARPRPVLAAPSGRDETPTPQSLAAPALPLGTLTPGPVTGETPPAPTATPAGPVVAYSTDLLVDVSWVLEHLADPKLKLVEMSETDSFAAGHLPSAGNLRWPDLKLVDSANATIEAWRADLESRLAALGVTPEDSLVVYDDGTLWAARLWWVLEALGHRDKRVLDGGKAAWAAAGQPLSTAVSQPTPASYQGSSEVSALATADYILSRLGAPDVAIVDARRPQEYAGLDNDGAARGGHIPGAVNIPYDVVATPAPPRYFLLPQELAALYLSLGVTPEKEAIAYCATGVRSAVTYYSLRLLGYPRVLLYSASWDEWGNRPELPIES